MTHMLKKQTTPTAMGSPSGGAAALAMHRESRMISKVIQPKIRIIHIFAPEIIKTDVANFRELVQHLTGKPSPENNYNGKGNKGKGKLNRKTTDLSKQRAPLPTGVELGGVSPIGCYKDEKQPTTTTVVNTKLEVMMGGGGSGSGSASSPSTSDDQVWRSSSSLSSDDHHISNNNNNGGYLTAFTDLDDNFDFSTVFQMGSDHQHGSAHLNSFGETVGTQLSFRG